MRIVKIHEAKTHFSALIHDVEAGAEILISRGDTPVARLMPIGAREGKRKLGHFDGQPFYIADDFDEFLPEEWREYTE